MELEELGVPVTVTTFPIGKILNEALPKTGVSVTLSMEQSDCARTIIQDIQNGETLAFVPRFMAFVEYLRITFPRLYQIMVHYDYIENSPQNMKRLQDQIQQNRKLYNIN